MSRFDAAKRLLKGEPTPASRTDLVSDDCIKGQRLYVERWVTNARWHVSSSG